jgi:catechol 2,3-dioxygenase-like lactoylglutathione lyase family enzyme
MISAVAKVVVPVLDQDRAKAFWTDSVGFEARRDETFGDERWIEVAPVFFTCDDIQATYRELTERGVAFPLPPSRQHFGWWSLFEDPDGTRYALGQWT